MERHGERYGLLILDLPRFKAINDALGHLRGGAVLRTIGGGLAQTLRPGDTAYRFGGEEFVVLMRVTDQQPSARPSGCGWRSKRSGSPTRRTSRTAS